MIYHKDMKYSWRFINSKYNVININKDQEIKKGEEEWTEGDVKCYTNCQTGEYKTSRNMIKCKDTCGNKKIQ